MGRMVSIGIFLVVAMLTAVPEVRSERSKRELDFGAVMCLIECVGDYVNETAFIGKKDDAGSPICRHLNMGTVDAICSMYRQGRNCLNTQCPGRPLVEMLLHVASYGCDDHYEEFKKYVPCVAENCNFIENSCKTQCGSMMDSIRYTAEQKEKLEQIRRISQLRRGQQPDGTYVPTVNDDQGDLGQFDPLRNLNLDGICKYTDCYLQCSEKPHTQKCGADSYRFFKDTIYDFAPAFYHGIFPNTTTPPSSCRKFLNMGADNAAAAARSSWSLYHALVLALISMGLLTMIRS